MQQTHVEYVGAYTYMLFIGSDTLSLGLKASRMCEERMLVSGRTPCPWRQVATQYPTWSHGAGPVWRAQCPTCHTSEPLCPAVPQSSNTTHSHTNILCWFYHDSVCDFHGHNLQAQLSYRGLRTVFAEVVLQLASSDYDVQCALGLFAAKCESSRDEGQHLRVKVCGLSLWIRSESLLHVTEFKYLRVGLCLRTDLVLKWCSTTAVKCVSSWSERPHTRRSKKPS